MVLILIQVLFNMYDTKGDHFIDSEELYEVLKMLAGVHLSHEQINDIVETTIREADKDKDGKISFQEFSEVGNVLQRFRIFSEIFSNFYEFFVSKIFRGIFVWLYSVVKEMNLRTQSLSDEDIEKRMSIQLVDTKV